MNDPRGVLEEFASRAAIGWDAICPIGLRIQRYSYHDGDRTQEYRKRSGLIAKERSAARSSLTCCRCAGVIYGAKSTNRKLCDKCAPAWRKR